MPRLWDDTIDAHRQAVRSAVLEAAWALVAERGLASVTMSQVAEAAGIGRATLYKYFADVDAMVVAWHEQQVGRHLEQLRELRGRPGSPTERLAAVLRAYAANSRGAGHHGADLAVLLHGGDHVLHARSRVQDLLRDLLAEAADAGQLRTDVPPDELATYCVHALTAAGRLPSDAAVRRLVEVTLAGLRP